MPTINTNIPFAMLPALSQSVIAAIQTRNDEVRSRSLSTSDLGYLGGLVSKGMPIRSAHGNPALKVLCNGIETRTVFYKNEFPSMGGDKVKYAWMSYAMNATTEHARGGIPTLIEFNGGSGQDTDGARILYEYVRSCFVYTPDHYTTWYLVTQNGAPVRG